MTGNRLVILRCVPFLKTTGEKNEEIAILNFEDWTFKLQTWSSKLFRFTIFNNPIVLGFTSKFASHSPTTELSCNFLTDPEDETDNKTVYTYYNQRYLEKVSPLDAGVNTERLQCTKSPLGGKLSPSFMGTANCKFIQINSEGCGASHQTPH